MRSIPQSRPASSRRRRGVTALLAVGLAGASAVAVTTAGPAQAEPTIPLQILAFNDYHGHVTDDTAGDIDDQDAGGGEYLAAKLAELRAGKTNTLTVAAGDLIGGSPFFSGLFHDEPSVESLNAMNLDISGVGNHEFDEGVTELLRMQNGGCHPVDGCYFTDYDPDTPGDQEFGGADYNWLAANVIDDNTMMPIMPAYEIRDVDGQKVAFIGMTLEGTDELVAAAGIVDITFQDEVDTANALIPEITGMGAEAIVVLIHEGGVPTPFAINGCQGISGPIVAINEGLDPEIDVIISGHTHQPYTCMLNDPDDNPRAVTSAYAYGRVVTEINLLIDDVTGEIDRSSVEAVNHTVIQSELTPDAAVTAVIDKWSPLADAKGNDPVGSVTETITRGGDPTGSDRGVESAAGNLVADAQLYATTGLGAEIALMNPGGVRSDLEYEPSGDEDPGVVTYGEAFTFQPFNNTIFTFPMTGAQIVSVLEEQCQPGDASRPVLHLGVSDGLTYDLEITTVGSICTDIVVSNVKLNGVDLVPGDSYMVTANNFLADGGDNFETFAEIDPATRLDGGQDLDALISYLTDQSPVAPPPTDRVNEVLTKLPGPIAAVQPGRVLESRDDPDFTTVDGEFEGIGMVEAGGVVELVIAGRAGIAADASAVVLNVGAINPVDNGFLTIYPCVQNGEPVETPLASSLNYVQDDIVSNAVLATVGEEGKVCIYTHAATHLIADVNSEVPNGGSPSPIVPARYLETRVGIGFSTFDGDFEGIGTAEAGSTIELVVAGRGDVAADADAVMMNLGAVAPEGNGFFTVWPCGEEQPLASSVNYFQGQVVSNAALAEIGEDGKVCIYTSETTEIIADVNAVVPDGGSPFPLGPMRLLETRDEPGFTTVDGLFEGVGRAAADSTIELDVADRAGIPADVDTVLLNVASILPSGPGFLTVHPCDEERPLASSVNYLGGDAISNAVVAKVGGDGKVCIYTLNETDIIVDLNAASSPPVPFWPAEEG